MKKINNNALLIFEIVVLIAGFIILFYPIVSNYLSQNNQIQVIKKYNETVLSENNNIEIEKEFEKAKIYNNNLINNIPKDPFDDNNKEIETNGYNEILNINNIIGYIKIPKISINLPIYHGTSKEILEKGIGHMENTAFPIGGKSSHSILVGHRGLPSSELFTNLDKLEINDEFYIYVLNKKLTYKIYEIETVEPTNLEGIQTIKNRDIVTLLTCTPYRVNTHRLLVHGERIEDTNEYISQNEDITLTPKSKIYYYAIVVLIILLLTIITLTIRKKYKKECKLEK